LIDDARFSQYTFCMVLIMRRPVLALALMLFAICSCDHFENVDLAQESPDRAYVTPSFVDNGDGTVTDVSANGLIWQKCASGWSGADCNTGTLKYTWGASPCGGGWRTPKKDELATINSSNNSLYFPGQKTDNSGEYFWSSDTYSAEIKYAVKFQVGGVPNTFNQSNEYKIRCVKTIQP